MNSIKKSRSGLIFSSNAKCLYDSDDASTSTTSDSHNCRRRTVSNAAQASSSNVDTSRAKCRTTVYGNTGTIRLEWSTWRFVLNAIVIAAQISLITPDVTAKRVAVDWTLESNLFNIADGIKTKYVRMNDVLNIRCAPVISLKIYMVPKESALFCRAPAAKDQDANGRKLRQTIGTCAPNSSSPTVKVRSTALANSPVFQPHQSYFLITTSTGTSEGVENEEGGLCQTQGMRLRLVVVDETDQLPNDEITSFDKIFPNLRMPANSNSHIEPNQILPGEERGFALPANRRKITAPSLRQVPPPNIESSSYGDAWQRRRLISGGESRPATPSTETVHSSRGFPAMLEVEENGRKKTITVYNSRQLHEEIEYAKERNNRIQHVREIPDYASVRQLPEYTMIGHGKISALPISTNRPLSGSRTRDVDGADAGVWMRSAALGSHRRNAASRSQPPANADDSGEPSVVRSPAYSSSLKAADATEHDNSNYPASSDRRPLPFTYVVGYTISDSGYSDTDDMILDEPVASSLTERCWSTWLLLVVCSLVAINVIPHPLTLYQ